LESFPLAPPPVVIRQQRPADPSNDDKFIRFNCPKCQKRIKAATHLGGTNTACRQCGQRMIVPMPLSVNDWIVLGENLPNTPPVRHSSKEHSTDPLVRNSADVTAPFHPDIVERLNSLRESRLPGDLFARIASVLLCGLPIFWLCSLPLFFSTIQQPVEALVAAAGALLGVVILCQLATGAQSLRGRSLL
jgi:DNA-directed RNA polymerase subunit RPC12/RpoP